MKNRIWFFCLLLVAVTLLLYLPVSAEAQKREPEKCRVSVDTTPPGVGQVSLDPSAEDESPGEKYTNAVNLYYKPGTSLTIKAYVTNPDYEVEGIRIISLGPMSSGNFKKVGGEYIYTYELKGDRAAITVSFKEKPLATLTVAIDPPNSGIVIAKPAPKKIVPKDLRGRSTTVVKRDETGGLIEIKGPEFLKYRIGTKVSLAPVPNKPKFVFDGWKGDAEELKAKVKLKPQNDTLTININSRMDRHVTACFKPISEARKEGILKAAPRKEPEKEPEKKPVEDPLEKERERQLKALRDLRMKMESGESTFTPIREKAEVPTLKEIKPSVPPSSQVAKSSPTFGAFEGAIGQWFGDGGCGVELMELAASGDKLILKGIGSDIALQIDGSTARGSGATLFGKPNHNVELTITADKLRLAGSHPSGGSCTSMFQRK
jgi:hypothetical protein